MNTVQKTAFIFCAFLTISFYYISASAEEKPIYAMTFNLRICEAPDTGNTNCQHRLPYIQDILDLNPEIEENNNNPLLSFSPTPIRNKGGLDFIGFQEAQIIEGQWYDQQTQTLEHGYGLKLNTGGKVQQLKAGNCPVANDNPSTIQAINQNGNGCINFGNNVYLAYNATRWELKALKKVVYANDQNLNPDKNGNPINEYGGDRILGLAQFQEKNNPTRLINIINTHGPNIQKMDPKNQVNWQAFKDVLKNVAQAPTIVMGDFNLDFEDTAPNVLIRKGDPLRDQRDVFTHHVVSNYHTTRNHNFSNIWTNDMDIDYFYHTEGLTSPSQNSVDDSWVVHYPAQKSGSDSDIHVGKFASDHFPVITKFAFTEPVPTSCKAPTVLIKGNTFYQQKEGAPATIYWDTPDAQTVNLIDHYVVYNYRYPAVKERVVGGIVSKNTAQFTQNPGPSGHEYYDYHVAAVCKINNTLVESDAVPIKIIVNQSKNACDAPIVDQTGFTQTGNSGSKVTISWKTPKNTSGLQNYQVYGYLYNPDTPNNVNDGMLVKGGKYIAKDKVTFDDFPSGASKYYYYIASVCTGDNGKPVVKINNTRITVKPAKPSAILGE